MNPKGISYRLYRDPPEEELTVLYRAAGWIGPEDTPDRIRRLIRGSFLFCGAFDEAGRLVGSMRALSDGVSDAYLLDLVVDPAFRRRGIAREILHRLSDHLRSLGVDWIVLAGAPGTESFYRTTDFRIMDGYLPYRLPEKGE